MKLFEIVKSPEMRIGKHLLPTIYHYLGGNRIELHSVKNDLTCDVLKNKISVNGQILNDYYLPSMFYNYGKLLKIAKDISEL